MHDLRNTMSAFKHCSDVCLKKTKINEKEAGKTHFHSTFITKSQMYTRNNLPRFKSEYRFRRKRTEPQEVVAL